MSGIQVGHLYRKRVVRNLRGEIIDWTDETDGGRIISKGQVLNQSKIDDEAKKEEDRREAAMAPTRQVESNKYRRKSRSAYKNERA